MRGGWKEGRLGDVLPIKYGKGRSVQFGYPRSETLTFGSNGPFGTFDRALTSKSSIIVGRKGAAGAVHYSEDPCWPIDTAFYTEGSSEIFLPFFRYLLQSLQLGSLDRSTAIPSLSRDDYDAKTIAFPESIHEQRSIVSEIEKQFTRLDAGVAALRLVQAKLKRYRAAILKAACEGRLVPTEAELAHKDGRSYETGDQLLARILAERRQTWSGRGKYVEPQAPDIALLSPLPEGWTRATMPQLGELNRGKSRHRPRDEARLYGGPYPFIQTGDVRKSGGKIRDHIQTYSEFGLIQSRLWPAGTLCITIAASIAETGILAFPACFPDSVVGFVSGGTATTSYIELFLRTAKEGLARFAPATAQKNINIEVLQNVVIPLPPFVEQERIVAEVERRLSVVAVLDQVVTANLLRAARLRQSILDRAFTGRLVNALD